MLFILVWIFQWDMYWVHFSWMFPSSNHLSLWLGNNTKWGMSKYCMIVYFWEYEHVYVGQWELPSQLGWSFLPLEYVECAFSDEYNAPGFTALLVDSVDGIRETSLYYFIVDHSLFAQEISNLRFIPDSQEIPSIQCILIKFQVFIIFLSISLLFGHLIKYLPKC